MGSRLEKGSEAVRKRIEGHTFDDEEGEEYDGSKFGGFSDYFRRKKIKLQNLDAQIRTSSSGKPQIFKGIIAHVNGYTQPSLNDLHHLIVCHGGGFMQYLDGKTTVTHIIAASLTPKKAIEFRRYRIVKPAWVVDSIKAEKLLPWDLYRVLEEGAGQKLLGFDEGKIVSQATPQQQSYRDQSSASWYASQVKGVAENIDDEEDTYSPDTQPLTQSGYPGTQSSNAFNALDGISTTSPKYQSEMERIRLSPAVKRISKTPGSESTPKNLRRSVSSGSSPPPKRVKAMTAEEHNAALLADPKIAKSSTANPEFLKQYYSESRLHHLSTWKAGLKAKFQQMASERSLSQVQAQKRKLGTRRYIMHVDFDSFFCAVSLKASPQYIDKPAAVAHGSGSGSEIASCNYPARAFGVKNGMWMKQALKLCPELKVLPYDFPSYEEVSQGFYDCILDVGGVVQSVSIDEALVDISNACVSVGGGIWREQEKADEISQGLRERIKARTGCTVSVGIGRNILLAKVALRRAKPAGQHQIKPEEELEFIGDLTVQDLPGVAYSIGGKLEEIGIKFVKDIWNLTKDRLITVLGPKTGEKIWDYSHGIDRVEVGEQVVRKSVSAEVNWGIRFISQREAEEFTQNLCGELHKRLLEQQVKGRQLTMKIMRRAVDAPLDPPKHLGHGKCDTFNKSIALGVATNAPETIGREAISILRSYGFSPGELRGLGVQMTKLEPLKGTVDTALDGSQKRISFKPSTKPKAERMQAEDPIVDDESPRKPRTPVIHPAAPLITGSSGAKPLNIAGTQFILPSQIDPTVLAELPLDIRSRLMTQGKKSASLSRATSPTESRSQSPIPNNQISLPSQLDPEVFNALPEELKAEVLAQYHAHANNTFPMIREHGGQNLLPQSPRKNRIINPLKIKPPTPSKKRAGVLPRGRGRPPKILDSNSTLTQSNLMARIDTRGSKVVGGEDDELEDISPEILAALPEDIRLEVLAQHRLDQLAMRSNLNLSNNPSKKKIEIGEENEIHVPQEKRKIKLPPRPRRPTFTVERIWELSELRETISDWHNEFGEEGPHSDDTSALGRYLRRVVLEERDMAKTVGVVKWLDWVVSSQVEDDDSKVSAGTDKWRNAVHNIKVIVEAAVRERGLGGLEL